MRIAQIQGMNNTIPSSDLAASREIAMLNSSVFLAATEGHDVTIYAPDSSELIPYAQKVAQKHNWLCDIMNDGKTIKFSVNEKEGTLSLRGPEGEPPTGADATDETKIEKDRLLLRLLTDDHRKESYDIINTHHVLPSTHDRLLEGIRRNGMSNQHVGLMHSRYLPQQQKTLRYPFICMSNRQKERFEAEGMKSLGVAYHGVDSADYKATEKDAGYLCFLGRMHELKGAHRAVDIAKATGKPLIIASNVHEYEQDYFDSRIKRHITHTDEEFLQKYATAEALEEAIKDLPGNPPIIFVGSVDLAQKQTLYGNAYATLFPGSWEEPFGLVQIESMACGTPVIGVKQYGHQICGAVAEVIEDGKTGYTVTVPHDDDPAQLENNATAECVNALQQLGEQIAREGKAQVRQQVRDGFEEKWTLEENARQLIACFRKVINANISRAR
jgi:glycosyltransferase involved in cell wall biosynthesis